MQLISFAYTKFKSSNSIINCYKIVLIFWLVKNFNQSTA